MLLCLQLTCRVESSGRTVTHKVLLIDNNDKLSPATHLLFLRLPVITASLHGKVGDAEEERERKGGKTVRGFVKVIHSYLRK